MSSNNVLVLKRSGSELFCVRIEDVDYGFHRKEVEFVNLFEALMYCQREQDGVEYGVLIEGFL